MNIQISEELFFDLARYHLLDQRGEGLENRIREGLEQKNRRMAARQQYAERLKAEGKARKQPSPE